LALFLAPFVYTLLICVSWEWNNGIGHQVENPRMIRCMALEFLPSKSLETNFMLVFSPWETTSAFEQPILLKLNSVCLQHSYKYKLTLKHS
jgi:hypothetical protein